MKNFRKMLFRTVLIEALLVSSACAFLTLEVKAAQLTAQQKSLTILNDVAGFNMTAYTPILNVNEQDSFQSIIPQTTADYYLMSSRGELRARCSFVNDNLHQIFISDQNGALSLNQPATDAVSDARGFLERYQDYTGALFYGGLKSMLDTVGVNENATRTMGNVQLKVSVIGQTFVDFMWTYVDENGVTAPSKNVVLSYQNGLLKAFLDNWQLYQIANEPVLSSEQALAIAVNASKSYSYTMDDGKIVVSDFNIASVGNVSVCYLNYQDAGTARGGDPFTLFPSWYVPLGFDKVYPGCVTGVTVRVWADTGEVSGISPMVYGGAPVCDETTPTVQPQEQAIILAAPVAAVVLVGVAILFDRNKANITRVKGFRKSGSLKLCATLLCLLISFSSIITTVPKAHAIFGISDDNKSMIYASTYEQIDNEKAGALQVCNTLESLFNDRGYNTTNAYGENSVYNYTIENIEISETNHDCVALFWWGHMSLYGDAYCDDSGTAISYEDISSYTTGKHYFVWSWVCMSANNESSGLPVAWTQDSGMSEDGYADPEGDHCYIGFEESSPTINNSTGDFNSTAATGKSFIMHVYAYALYEGYSINDALDLASYLVFSSSYSGSPLNTGYYSWYPGDHQWHWGCMHVYGDGTIHLAEAGRIKVTAWDYYDEEWYAADVDVYIDSQYAGTTNYEAGLVTGVMQGNHTVEVGEAIYCEFTSFTFDFPPWGDTNNPTTVYVPADEQRWIIAAYDT